MMIKRKKEYRGGTDKSEFRDEGLEKLPETKNYRKINMLSKIYNRCYWIFCLAAIITHELFRQNVRKHCSSKMAVLLMTRFNTVYYILIPAGFAGVIIIYVIFIKTTKEHSKAMAEYFAAKSNTTSDKLKRKTDAMTASLEARAGAWDAGAENRESKEDDIKWNVSKQLGTDKEESENVAGKQ